MAIPLLPFLDPAPYQIPLVDPKTGMMTEAWQRYHINLERVIFGSWTEVPYAAANFRTDNAGITWNVAAGQVTELSYWQMGNIAVVFYTIVGTTVSADVGQLWIQIPTLRQRANSATKTKAVPAIVNVQIPGPLLPTEMGQAATLNPPAEQPLVVRLIRNDGVVWPVAANSISVIGMVICEVLSVVTP